MKFETLTFVPFDLDAIEPSLLSQVEKEQLNNYHKQVYDMISPYLTDKETQWLRNYTREI
jgi:Xaa-Pro aminopeptidase